MTATATPQNSFQADMFEELTDDDVEKVDEKTALLKGEHELRIPTGEIPDMVERGDEIETSYGTGGEVVKVVESDRYGIPVWTIVYVELDAEPGQNGYRQEQYKWINELVVYEGEIRKLFEANEDTIEVKGKAKQGQTGLASFR